MCVLDELVRAMKESVLPLRRIATEQEDFSSETLINFNGETKCEENESVRTGASFRETNTSALLGTSESKLAWGEYPKTLWEKKLGLNSGLVDNHNMFAQGEEEAEEEK